MSTSRPNNPLTRFTSDLLRAYPPFLLFGQHEGQQSTRLYDRGALLNIFDEYFATTKLKAEKSSAPNVTEADYQILFTKNPLPKKLISSSALIAKARELEEELNEVRKENPGTYSKLVESAKLNHLLIDELGKIILCQVNIDPKNPKVEYHDYFAMEKNLGVLAYGGKPKALNLAELGKFSFHTNYHDIVIEWFYKHPSLIIADMSLKKAALFIQAQTLAARSANLTYSIFAHNTSKEFFAAESKSPTTEATHSPRLSLKSSAEEVD